MRGILEPNEITVNLGGHEIRKDGKNYAVSKIIPHENYRPWRHYHDIALIKLAEKVTFDDNVSAVCLPTLEMDKINYDDQSVMLMGWGTTSYGGELPKKLRTTQVPIVSNEECHKSYAGSVAGSFMFPEGINHNFICAGLPEGGKDSCQGDSGGPMIYKSGGTEPAYQLGVVSFGKECAKPGFPGVYTRVTYHLKWIGTRIRDN
ncbi:clotting factor B-like protein [Dinothrombium tinctorium]|uniref:Clotting factor B-like protein n=1 Tax=Dinothrombium tinctorium TaxID=1965070 RepID=A0A3S4RCE2_9ACAR|nr:clotting factor B-like protein [Dinothrombium tinctorium]